MKKQVLFLLFVTFIAFIGCTKKNESRDSIILEEIIESVDSVILEESDKSSEEKISIKELTDPLFTRKLKDKIDGYSKEVFDGHEIFRTKRINEYYDMYFYFYGKTKEAIIEKCGTNYEVEELEIISGYDYEYDRKEEFVYTDMYFVIYSDDDGKSRLLSYEVFQQGGEYYGDIIIGCDFDVIIKQLGKPNSFAVWRYTDSRNYSDKYSIGYDVAGYFQIRFTFGTNYKLERISIHEDMI
jgi:hypothetical protein